MSPRGVSGAKSSSGHGRGRCEAHQPVLWIIAMGFVQEELCHLDWATSSLGIIRQTLWLLRHGHRDARVEPVTVRRGVRNGDGSKSECS
jgi:hypothetical protein